MGFLGSVTSFVSSAVSSVASVASRVVSSAYQTAKKVVGATIGFLATKAEKLVESVKKTWTRVKPYVEQFRGYIKIAADYVPFPWLKAALFAVDKGIDALFAFEKSPVAKKIEEAIQWAIKLSKKIHNQFETEEEAKSEQEETVLSEAELQVAKQHQANIYSAEDQIQSTGMSHEIALLTAVNDYEIARAEIAKVLKEAPQDFEHYLRLRATQKLLKMADKTFRFATEIKQISADDIFLVRVASDLIKADPELSEAAAVRLDSILQTRFGKKLTPFVFEEMIASWANASQTEDQKWEALNKTLIREKMLEKTLSTSKKIQGELSTEEEATLQQLLSDIPSKEIELKQIETKRMDIDRYVGASEGFLQLLEKDEDQIIAEGNEFLIEESPLIGAVLMRCAEKHIPFSELDEEEQDLIRDYANIFKKDARERMNTLLTVTA